MEDLIRVSLRRNFTEIFRSLPEEEQQNVVWLIYLQREINRQRSRKHQKEWKKAKRQQALMQRKKTEGQELTVGMVLKETEQKMSLEVESMMRSSDG